MCCRNKEYINALVLATGMSLQQAYPVGYTKPIREQLDAHGVKELLSNQDVQDELSQDAVLVLINSVCGCAAANARPALYALMKEESCPTVATVFAGVHQEATAAVRERIDEEPSSPSFAYFKDGQCVFFLPRYEIEGASAHEVKDKLLSGISASN